MPLFPLFIFFLSFPFCFSWTLEDYDISFNFQGFSLKSVYNAGDFNGDSLQDLIFSNPNSDNATLSLFYGPISANLNLNYSNASVTFQVPTLGNPCGTGFASYDLNKDGYTDYLIGCPLESTNGLYQNGAVYLVYGNSSFPSTFNLSDSDVIFHGTFNQSKFGSSIAVIGDFNNDTFPDFAIGAPEANSTFGEVVIYFGPSFSTNTSIFGFNLCLLGSGLAGVSVHVNDPSNLEESDFNNDGIADVMMSCDGLGVYVFFGVSAPLPLNITGLSYINGTTGFSIIPNNGDAPLGPIVKFGDFDNDGISDCILGCPRYQSPSVDDGRVFVLFGNSSWNTESFFDLDINVTIPGRFFHIPPTGTRFGESIQIGDFNSTGSLQLFVTSTSSPINLYLITNESSSSISSSYFTNTPSYTGIGNVGDINGDRISDFFVASQTDSFGYFGDFHCSFIGSGIGYSLENSKPDCSFCPFVKGFQPNSTVGNCSQVTPVQCDTNQYAFLVSPFYDCLECPFNTDIGFYSSPGNFSTFCKFTLSSKCPAGHFLRVSSGQYFDTYQCIQCKISGQNPLENIDDSCKCPSGTLLMDQKCIRGSQSFSPSPVGASVYSSFAAVFGIFFIFQRKRGISKHIPSTNNTPSCIPLKAFIKLKPHLKDKPLVSAFYGISMFIWSPFLSKSSLSSLFFTYPQILTILSYWKPTPFVPKSLSHFTLTETLALFTPFFYLLGIFGIIFSLSIQWSDFVFGNWTSWFFVFYFGKNFYSAGVWCAFSLSVVILISARFKPEMYTNLVSFFLFPLLFNFLSIFNCIGKNQGNSGSDSLDSLVYLSSNGENLTCWSTHHSFLFVCCFLSFTAHTLYVLKNQLKIPNYFSVFYLMLGYSFFSSEWISSVFFQITCIFVFCLWIIVSESRKNGSFVDLNISDDSSTLKSPTHKRNTQRDFFIFSHTLCVFFSLLAYIAAGVNDSSNPISGILIYILLLLAFFIGVPTLEHRFSSFQDSFFFGENEKIVRDQEESHDLKSSMVSSSVLAILFLLLALQNAYPIDNNLDPFTSSSLFESQQFTSQTGSFGSYVSIGDYNGDSYKDFIIDDPNFEILPDTVGKFFVYLGNASQYAPSSDTSTFTGPFAEGLADDFLGVLCRPGDSNNDGKTDIFVLLPNAMSSQALLYYGTSSLSGSIPVQTLYSNSAGSGSTFATTGDFGFDLNNDGYDDLIIGDPDYIVSTSGEGQSTVVFGPFSGSSFDIQFMSPGEGIFFNGYQTDGSSGSAIASPGDVNNDTIDDLLISASFASPNAVSNAGEVYLIYGSSSLPDTFNLINSDIIFNGTIPGETLKTAQYSGDFNGDGLNDILLYGSQNCYLIYSPPSSIIDLSSLNGSNGVKFTSTSKCQWLSDINNDGYSEILSWSVGKYSVIFANQSFPATFNVSAVTHPESVMQFSGYNDLTFYSDDLNNDSFADILVGSGSNKKAAIIYGAESWAVCLPYHRVNNADCDICPNSTSLGRYNPQVSSSSTCELVLWSTNNPCTPSQFVSLSGVSGSCVECGVVNNGKYPQSTAGRTHCFPLCNSGFYVDDSTKPFLQCKQCSNSNLNPIPNNFTFCQCSDPSLDPDNNCEPFGTTISFSPEIGSFSSFFSGSIILISGSVYFIMKRFKSDHIEEKIDPKPMFAPTLADIDSLISRIDTSLLKDFQQFCSLVFDLSICLLYMSKSDQYPQLSSEDVELTSVDDQIVGISASVDTTNSLDLTSVDTTPNSTFVDTDNTSSEIPSTVSLAISTNTDPNPPSTSCFNSPKNFAKLSEYLLNTPFLPNSQLFYSPQDKIAFFKTIIETLQLIGLLSGLSFLPTTMANTSHPLLNIFSFLNLNLGSQSFSSVFWICIFLVILWNLLIFGRKISSGVKESKIIELVLFFDYRFIPLLGGIFVIPIVSTLLKPMVCNTSSSDKTTYISATVSPQSVENGIVCFESTHILYLVFSFLGLVTFLPTVLAQSKLVQYFSKTQFIHNPQFLRINLAIKLFTTTITTFFGTNNEKSFQIVTCVIMIFSFIVIFSSVYRIRPCFRFNSFRFCLSIFGILYSLLFLFTLSFGSTANQVSVGIFFSLTGCLLSSLVYFYKKIFYLLPKTI